MEIGGKTEKSIMVFFFHRAYNVVLRTLVYPGSQRSHKAEAKACQLCRMKHLRASGYLPCIHVLATKHYYVNLYSWVERNLKGCQRHALQFGSKGSLMSADCECCHCYSFIFSPLLTFHQDKDVPRRRELHGINCYDSESINKETETAQCSCKYRPHRLEGWFFTSTVF